MNRASHISQENLIRELVNYGCELIVLITYYCNFFLIQYENLSGKLKIEQVLEYNEKKWVGWLGSYK